MRTTPIKFNDVFRITWNPAESAVADIFADDIARAIWCTWKEPHVVNQFFNDEVRYLAKELRKAMPSSADKLHRSLIGASWGSEGQNIIGTDLAEWCEFVLPYVRGEKAITVTVP